MEEKSGGWYPRNVSKGEKTVAEEVRELYVPAMPVVRTRMRGFGRLHSGETSPVLYLASPTGQ